MSKFSITQITKKKIDSISHMLAPEIVSAVKEGQPVTALAAVEDDTAVGALGGVVDGDTFEIISIYVIPSRRRNGAGTALMKTIFELADEEDLMVRAEYTPMDSEGKTIEPFLNALDFIKESAVFPVYCCEALGSFSIDSKNLPGTMSEILTFAEAPEKLIRDAIKQSREEDGMLGDIEGFMGIIKKGLSFLAARKGMIQACVMAEQIQKDAILLTPVWGVKPDMEEMRMMLSFAFDEMRASLLPDTSIIIPALNPETLEIIEEICGTSAIVTLSFLKKSFVSI